MIYSFEGAEYTFLKFIFSPQNGPKPIQSASDISVLTSWD